MEALLNFGQNVGKWTGQVYSNVLAIPIKSENKNDLKKPDAYKSINSSSLKFEPNESKSK